MAQELKYNGYTTNPSDNECLDGDLALSLGLINEDGALQPVLPPSVKLQFPEGFELRFEHKTGQYTHYILTRFDEEDGHYGVYYFDAEQEIENNIVSPLDLHSFYWLRKPVSHINAIGNTLIVFSDEGIDYCLWKNNEEGYRHLGNRVPQLDFSLGLIARPKLFSTNHSIDERHLEYDGSHNFTFDDFFEVQEDKRAALTEEVMTKVNKFVAEETLQKSRFCFPFFVRYAIRLYDGSLVNHSAPILMQTTTRHPVVLILRGAALNYNLDMFLLACSLDYKLIINNNVYRLEEWRDLIKSVDIFISKPIYTYDQSGLIESFVRYQNWETGFVGKLKEDEATYTDEDGNIVEGHLNSFDYVNKDFLNWYCAWDYRQIYTMFFKDGWKGDITVNLPALSDEVEKNKYVGLQSSIFYKLHSIDIEEILNIISTGDNERYEIEVKPDYLNSLTSKEQMSDDYLSREMLFGKYSFIYNNRLNLTGVRRRPFEGFVDSALFNYCEYDYNYGAQTVEGKQLHDISLIEPDKKIAFIEVYINRNGQQYKTKVISNDIKIKKFCSSTYIHPSLGPARTRRYFGGYVFYPNKNAYAMVITDSDGSKYVIELTQHEYLEGSYGLIETGGFREDNSSEVVLPNIEQLAGVGSEVEDFFPFREPSKIISSETNNPFYFPLENIYTISSGDILGISAATKALSEGQFGQFPMYAFTTEGVWAMEVNPNTGSFSARQPITRDVCINPDSILSIDQAVLFATDRGIMLIRGSETTCISDAIDSNTPFDIKTLPSINQLVYLYNKNVANVEDTITTSKIDIKPFNEFLRACKMIYDYVNQRIIVYMPNTDYAYVYSLKSKNWGMMQSNIVSGVNSYPEALAMGEGGKLLDFSNPIIDKAPALAITRPFHLGDPFGFKTINTIIQRGMFKNNHVAQVLYGSNDMYNWLPVWSSVDKYLRGFRGTPYKYYRLALICNLDKGESIYGCSVDFAQRLANQLR